MFRRILIANRGEIALRIIRACRALSIESVVAVSEADREAPWVEAADASICVGPAAASRSYLDATAILQAAEQTECQAIHPGYGFLSENARFAARCEQQGLTFIGPSARAMRLMGAKAEAKRTMRAGGVPTIPGSEGTLASVAEAVSLATAIGYPVLLKATAGGGGKGIRLCTSEAEVRAGYASASMEAEKAFGNASLYLEKYLTGGRHIEFQILCDGFGNGIHLGERECTIQRSHQKLVEESPSPAIDATRRAEMGGRIARAVAGFGYKNAGTVEFLLAPDDNLYFMEMNARLQVEHPVTEMVTGIDLVAAQLRIAANEPLGRTQESIAFTGHAIEFRINAEDPAAGFKPTPGTITAFEPPGDVAGVTVRWDSAMRLGYRVPPWYDSMIGKLIVHGPDRGTTLDGAREALASLRIEGVATTIALHQRIVDDATFRSGRFDVGFLAARGLIGGGA